MPEIRERTPNALLKSDDDDSLQAEIERWEGEGGSCVPLGQERGVKNALATLARICRGRENMRHVTDRRTTVRDPDDDRRNPDKDAERQPRIERRQVPLDFDRID